MSRNTLRRPAQEIRDFHGIITVSPVMEAFFAMVERVAATESSVLIRGETGTGKELIARAIHVLSRRASGPFRALNCATLTSELLASELFGHVRGAFTGAVRDRQGLFSLANKGTIFLDEIAELPLEIQARLLRVLQERTFIPLGGTEPVQVDVRLISATHQALRRAVVDRRFREDLMYRVRVVPIFLPPLRQRAGDVQALTWHFIDHFNHTCRAHHRGHVGREIDAVDQAAMDALVAYPWPGNIRELRNVIEYAFAVGVGPVLTCADLTPELRGEPPPDESTAPVQNERHRIEQALRDAEGKKAIAAERLGMSRSTLWRKMRELKISGASY